MADTSLINKANTPNEIITKEEYERRVKEIVKCKRDITYFANNYFKILTLDKGTINIKLYPKQEELLLFFKNEKRAIALAPRQSGKTVSYTIFCLWQTIFFPEKKVLILANKMATALEIIERIQRAIENLPNWLSPKIVVWNKGEIVFSNGSGIRGLASSSSAARGMSANCLIFDEFAFLPKNIADLIFTSTYPVISSSEEGKMIIVSTPNGTADNLYYDLWQKANSKFKNNEGWKAFEMHWWDVPGRDEKFKEMTIASIGQKRWDQEFACEFLSPSDFRKLIPEDILEKHKMRLDQFRLQNEANGREMQIISKDETKVYNFTMWECFDQKKTYLASGDVAEGTGNDSSVLYIWDVTDLSKISLVCKFASNEVSVLEFAYVSVSILELYANPYLIIESNSIGSSFLDIMRITYEYQNIVQEGSKNNIWGVRSHASVKPRACLWTRDMFTTAGFDWIIKDGDLLKEIGTFVKKEGTTALTTYAAMGNAHDDLVMSMIWCAWILNPSIVEKYFVAAEYFTSSLGVIYPKILHPGFEYTKAEIEKALSSQYYKEFQETVAKKRKELIEDKEIKKQLAEKERNLKALERRISETDYSKMIIDPFNPKNNVKDEAANKQTQNIPGIIVGDIGRFGSSWNDSDFEGESW